MNQVIYMPQDPSDKIRPPASQPQGQTTTQYAPPPGPPPASASGNTLAKPTLPERKPSAAGTGPQPDDLEDVKRVCFHSLRAGLLVCEQRLMV